MLKRKNQFGSMVSIFFLIYRKSAGDIKAPVTYPSASRTVVTTVRGTENSPVSVCSSLIVCKYCNFYYVVFSRISWMTLY
jgi:hypothetical protein